MSNIKELGGVFVAFTSALLLCACAGGIVPGHKTRITSVPSGADVFARGEKIGKTPLEINPNQAFPPSWSNSAYQASGLLKLTYPGCEGYTKHVDDSFLSGVIHVNLKCIKAPNQIQKKVESKPTEKVPAASNKTGMPQKRSIDLEKRLERVEILYKKGLITKDEYQKVRARILDEL